MASRHTKTLLLKHLEEAHATEHALVTNLGAHRDDARAARTARRSSAT